jgi:GAF domain-containing protein
MLDVRVLLSSTVPINTSGGYLWGSIDLIRESGSPDFKPREANLLRHIAPHLGNGLKMAALRLQTPAE